MSIHSIQGSLMDVAPKVAKAMVIWAYNGFNSRSTIWSFELFTNCKQVRSILPRAGHVIDSDYKGLFKPWYLEQDSMWKLEPNSFDKLDYIYFFSNPDDNLRLKSIIQIDKLINRCLDSMKAYEIDSVAMLHIPAGDKTDENDIESARRMVNSIQQWMDNNGEMDVYLVDRLGDFDRVM